MGRRCKLLLGAMVGVCAALLWPVAATTTSAPPTAPEAGLVSAQRDYAAIKAARSASANSTVDLPQVETPAMAVEPVLLAPPPPPVGRSTNQSAAPDAKSGAAGANWLVDAMQAGQPQRAKSLIAAAGRGTTAPSERVSTGATAVGRRSEPDERSRDSQDSDALQLKKAAAAANPLAAYMHAWIAPADRGLLLGPSPAAAPEFSLGDLLTPPGVSPGPAPGSAVVSGRPDSSLAAFARGAGEPMDNPYLPDFANPPMPPATQPASAPLAATPTPNPPPGTPAIASSGRTEPTLADQLKAQDDEAKAFRQLKRF